MLFVISPAKSLDYENAALTEAYTQPSFIKDSEQLIAILRQFDSSDISDLMSVSEKISELNVSRYRDWQPNFTPQNSKQAIYAFKGDVYTGLSIESAEQPQVDYIQKHLRILSGLYGVLKPLDLMQAYRLEMGTKLENDKGKNLYDFWGDKITDYLNQTIEDSHFEVFVNLASNEYYKSVKQKNIKARVITPVFKDLKAGKYKIVSFYAKKARGLMVRYAADHLVTQPDQLKAFNYSGYAYNEALSKGDEWVFTRDEVPST